MLRWGAFTLKGRGRCPRPVRFEQSDVHRPQCSSAKRSTTPPSCRLPTPRCWPPCYPGARKVARLQGSSILRRSVEVPPERRAGRKVAAHPVHAAAGRGRGRAEVDPGRRGGVGVGPGHRARERLAQVLEPARDVAADVGSRCPAPAPPARRRGAREDAGRGSPARSARSGARCARSCPPASRWGRGSRPRRCAGRPARGVGSNTAGLGQQHERALGVAAGRDLRLGRGDLGHRAAEVDRRRPRALGRAPGDRPLQRPVDLERAGAVAVAQQARPVGRRQARAARSPPPGAGRRPAAPRAPAGSSSSEVTRRPVSSSPPSARRRATSASVIRPRAAAGHRPADRVAQGGEQQAEAAGQGRVERAERVRGHAREQRARAVAAEAPPQRRRPSAGRGGRSAPAPAGGGAPRGAARARRRSDRWRGARAGRPGARRRRRRPPGRRPSRRPSAPAPRRVPSSRGWARGASGWTSSIPMLLQRQPPEEGRAGEGVDRRADVVDEAGQRQLGRAAAAPRRVGGLEHQHRAPGLGDRERRGEPVRPRPDDDGVPARHRRRSCQDSRCACAEPPGGTLPRQERGGVGRWPSAS